MYIKINVQCNTNKQIKSGINEFCEMANMPEMGLEIFNAGGGWRDQKWAPSWSVKLPSLRQGRVQTLPCSLGRQSAHSFLDRGKPRLSALKRWVGLSCFTCLRCAESFAEYCDILLSCQYSPIYIVALICNVRRVTLCKCDGKHCRWHSATGTLCYSNAVAIFII
ncbi:hypothetical protein T12_8512 [Trichinella patagoniensis]|uniref:Uncharacterized protein n=1 Tax=Trichinella patagoniensis TaxID=990121 RepID=A0A0V1AFL6_9BILA|nr:hypothetical protein T12_8512 [Trichinella patagoniensis]